MTGPGIEPSAVQILDLRTVVHGPEGGDVAAPDRGHDANGIARERVRLLPVWILHLTVGDIAPKPTHSEGAPTSLHAISEPGVESRDLGFDDVLEALVDCDLTGHALDAAVASARRALGVVQHCPGGVVPPWQIRGGEPVPVGDEVERALAGLEADGAPLRPRRLELGVAARAAFHLHKIGAVACARRRPALWDALDIGVILELGAVHLIHGGRVVALAPRAAQRYDVTRAKYSPESPCAQLADVTVVVNPCCGSYIH